MLKEVIVLTKSYKHGGYCVAGIDVNSGEWIRLVPKENRPIYEKDIIYSDGTTVDIFDVVKVDLVEKKPSYYQPENYILKNKPVMLRKSNIDEVLNLHPIENKNPIFYNNENKVSPDEIKKIPERDRYSLILIEAKNVELYQNDFGKVRCNFKCNFGYFHDYPITDINIKNCISKNNCINLNKSIFIMSLGENFEGYHYKLIAQIFR